MPVETTPDKLIVFLKAPRPGHVKTRLAQALGAEEACQVYRSLIDDLLRHFEALQNVELRFTPDDALHEIEQWRRPAWVARPQGEGDLGERLQRAFQQALAAGAKRVVVIGADCPDVTAQDIEMAWTSLMQVDVVIGPAADGGYWLLGLARLYSVLFQNIPWSTNQVLRETLARAQEASLRVQVLSQYSDVDTEGDWKNYQARRRPAS